MGKKLHILKGLRNSWKIFHSIVSELIVEVKNCQIRNIDLGILNIENGVNTHKK